MKVQQYSKSDKQRLIKKFNAGTTSLGRFCLHEGVSQSLFRAWLKESESIKIPEGGFVSLQFVELEGNLFPVLLP